MSETYRIKIGRRGLPGSEQGRITEPYTLEDLKRMFSAYMEEGIIAGLSPREVKLVETAAGALEKLKKGETSQENGVGEQGNPLLDRANTTIERLEAEAKQLWKRLQMNLANAIRDIGKGLDPQHRALKEEKEIESYVWRDTKHGPQLWANTSDGGGRWALWYGIGAIGISDELRHEIEWGLSGIGWSATDEARCAEIERLQEWIRDLQSGMYVNCVYCGHRYGSGEETPVAMADVLKEHIEQCPEHPLSVMKAEVVWLQEWAAKNGCENSRWPPVSVTSESSDCGECVPCKARAALKRGEG